MFTCFDSNFHSVDDYNELFNMNYNKNELFIDDYYEIL